MPANNKLNKILQQTEESINNKDLRFKVQNAIPDNLKKDYYEKYLNKTIDERSVKMAYGQIKTQHGEKEVEIKYNAMPIHHYNTLLAMAFYKAHEFYNAIRNKVHLKAAQDDTIELPEAETDEEIFGEISSLSAVECLMMSRQIKQGKNSTLMKTIKQGDRRMLNEFQKIERLCAKVLEELRNYHAHIFHEPGPVHFDNLYGDDYKPPKKISTGEWQTVRNYFETLFDDVKKHLLKTTEQQLLEYKHDIIASKEINQVKKRLNDYVFRENGIVTNNALLFIACYFLRKSNANFFIKKWPGIKKTEGFSKTSQTFFNYYSVKDSKSLHAINNDNFKFRQLTGLLGTMPVLKNDCFRPFYELIKENNNYHAEKLERERDKLKKEIIQSNIIPLRKNQNYTSWYIGYLKERGLLNGFTIAFYKQIEDRGRFLESHIKGTIEVFKEKMKKATGEEKRKLTAIYKEAKKNFIFKEASATDDNFCTKRENAILRYAYKGNDGKETSIQVNLSPVLLMKWVFADIYLDKGEEVKRTLIKFISANYKILSSGRTVDSLEGLPASKIFPSSLLHATEEQPSLTISTAKAKEVLQNKIYNLQKFIDENNSKRAPWKFAAKRKIDIIFDIVHLKYLGQSYDLNKNEATMRHEALNDTEYLNALELIRFYGKEYQSEQFKTLFKKDKQVYFNSIIKYFDCNECTSLEKLFQAVSNDYIDYLKLVEFKINPESINKFIKVFKLNKPSLKCAVEEHAKRFAANQSLPHELVNIQSLTAGNLDCDKWKKENAGKDTKRMTDFSLMRFLLSKDHPFTNTDYMMQCIMPVLLKKRKLPLNQEGKIQGNTSLFNSLMSSKTEELVLWNIANYYWKKANGKENSINKNIILPRNQSDHIQPAYRNTSIYSKLYKEPIEIKLQRSENDAVYPISIKPTKFDDEFQHYKQETLIDYIELCMTDQEKMKKPWQFEDLNKKIQDRLVKYLDDVYLLLTIEKYIVQKNISELKTKFAVKENGKLPEIHFVFGRIATAGQDNIDNIICNLIYKELSSLSMPAFTHKDLILYRNKTMHQQLLDDKTHKEIRKTLVDYCKQKGLFVSMP